MDDLVKAVERLMNISTPSMNGDNLAVTLCSHFDDGEDGDDDCGWSPSAMIAYDEIKAAIEAHFRPALTAAQALIAELEAEALENSRIIGMSAEREAADKARIAELEAELAGAYERAAKVAEDAPTPWDGDDVAYHANCVEAGGFCNGLEAAAAAIRNLKGTAHD